MNYKAGFRSVKHDELKWGDVVYIDNYEDGKFHRTAVVADTSGCAVRAKQYAEKMNK